MEKRNKETKKPTKKSPPSLSGVMEIDPSEPVRSGLATVFDNSGNKPINSFKDEPFDFGCSGSEKGEAFTNDITAIHVRAMV